MSKPQVATEPTMEEILASIRKMISDDKPGPSPLPDMGRTPFGESSTRSSPASEANGRGASETRGPARTSSAASTPSFNSLADALKVATTLSDQRRSLQQEIATVLEKGPRNNLEALTELSSGRADAMRSLIDERSEAPAAKSATSLPGENTELSSEGAAPGGEAKQDLLSFDFGTLVPQRDDARSKAGSDPKRGAASPISIALPDASDAKPEAKTEAASEPRILPLRTGLNGTASHGLNGSGPNVAPFPRPARDVGKAGEPDVTTAAASVVEEKPETIAEIVAEASNALAQPLSSAAEQLKSDTLAKHGEALLDAVVDLVQQQPGAFSVFTSGDSFISGVGGKKGGETLPAIAQPVPMAVDEPAARAPKMDRAAAELLRPMLRQWLAENMERILEEALRSELTGQVADGKPPSKG